MIIIYSLGLEEKFFNCGYIFSGVYATYDSLINTQQHHYSESEENGVIYSKLVILNSLMNEMTHQLIYIYIYMQRQARLSTLRGQSSNLVWEDVS